jgi:hypothetical protein
VGGAAYVSGTETLGTLKYSGNTVTGGSGGSGSLGGAGGFDHTGQAANGTDGTPGKKGAAIQPNLFHQ